MTHEQMERLREIGRAQLQRLDKPIDWHVFCECNHSAPAHGVLDYEAVGKIAAPCSECACQVFSEDPTYSPFADTDERPARLSRE